MWIINPSCPWGPLTFLTISGSATRWDACKEDNYWRLLEMTSWNMMRQLRLTHSRICYLPVGKNYFSMWLINGTFGCTCHETVVFKTLREVRIESSRMIANFYSGNRSVRSHGRQMCSFKVVLKSVRLLSTTLSKCRNRKNVHVAREWFSQKKKLL